VESEVISLKSSCMTLFSMHVIDRWKDSVCG